jgi:polyhydroxyalkanoate synthesis repressor PhaR
MSTPRMIKKYPNRRLYDTTESRYITRADVQKMVVDRVDFVVVDKTTREDITRSILLQIISQQEDGAQPMMSRDFLSRVIRTHDRATNGMTASYLEQSLKLLTAHIDAHPKGTETNGWDSAAAGGLAEQNYQRWRSVQEKICQTLDAAHDEAQDAAQLPAPAAPLPERPPLAAGSPLTMEAAG